MAYINEITKEYPRFIGDLQLLDPDATAENLPEGWVAVVDTLKPDYQEGKNIYEDAPKKVDGVWTQQWVIRDLTVDEIAQIKAQEQKVQDFLAMLEESVKPNGN